MRIAVFIVALCLLAAVPMVSAEPDNTAPDKAAPDEIILCDGKVLAGAITNLGEDGVLTVAVPDAESGERMHVNVIDIKAVRFDKALVRDPDGIRRGFVFRLADDTRITGRIVACDGAKFTLQTACVGRVQVAMNAVTHIITDPFAQISALRNDGPGCLFVLKDGSYVRGELLPPTPAEEGGRITEFRCKDGTTTRVLPLAQVCGLVMPAPASVAGATGWYARTYLANFDLVFGTLERIGPRTVTLATPLLGEIEISRAAIEDMIFGPKPRAAYDKALICHAGEVVECDELMRATRTYTTPQPIAATLLDNGNILVCDNRERSVCEVDRRGRVVWRRGELGDLTAALRLPNGNTIIAEYDLQAGRCLVVAPDGTDVGSMFEIGRETRRDSAADSGLVRVCNLSLLPNGNLLISDMTAYSFSRIIETTLDGKIVKLWGKGLMRMAIPRCLPNGEILTAAIDGNNMPPGVLFMLLDGGKPTPYQIEIPQINALCCLSITPAGDVVLARRAGNGLVFERYTITRDKRQSVVISLLATYQFKAHLVSGLINYEFN